MNTDGPGDKAVAHLLYGLGVFRIVPSCYATDSEQFRFCLSEPYSRFFCIRDELLQLRATRFDKEQITALSMWINRTINGPQTLPIVRQACVHVKK